MQSITALLLCATDGENRKGELTAHLSAYRALKRSGGAEQASPPGGACMRSSSTPPLTPLPDLGVGKSVCTCACMQSREG